MKKRFATMAMIMIWLIITLPIAGAQNIGNGEENFVRASIPEYSRSSIIDIIGTTQPNAIVKLYVDESLIETKTADADGGFVFRQVKLLQTESTIKLESDYQGDIAEETYATTIDDMPPTIQATIEDVVTRPNVNADITVSEDVELTITKTRAGKKPDKITGLKEIESTETEVEIEWDEQEDILEYLVYRDGKRIAKITNNYYDDATVGADTIYTYKVTAVSKECVESDISDSLTITTPIGEAQEKETQEIFASCYTPAVQKPLKKGTSKVQIELSHGQNIIKLEVQDKAGLTANTEKTVFYDTGPPIFIETNLEDMPVSYKSHITISGKVSEPAAITVYVNDKPVKTKPTAEDGTFSISDIELSKEIKMTTGNGAAGAAGLGTGIAWENKIKLEAVDIAGQKTTKEGIVAYSFCGYGTWFDVEFSTPMPDYLTPRLLYEGLQQVGVSYELKYHGSKDVTVDWGGIKGKLVKFSPAFAKDYDNELARINNVPARPSKPGELEGLGYIQVMFKEFNPLKDKKDAVLLDIENKIAEHRMNDCGDLPMPGMGCMRLFVELEIPFVEKTTIQEYDQTLKKTVAKTVSDRKTQKTCLEMNVMIEPRIPPKVILGNALLDTLTEGLDSGIKFIDSILKPIDFIGRHLFYGCIISTFLMFIPELSVDISCKFNAFVGAATKSGFDKNIAEIGMCKQVYSTAEQKTSQTKCQACSTAIKNLQKWENLYREVCDRVMCPAAPSVQTYLKDKGREKLKEVSLPAAVEPTGAYWKGDKIFAGSDCTAWVKEKYQGKPPKYFKQNDLQRIYAEYLEHRGDADKKQSWPNCYELHPATPQCCGYEYMQQWGSACGISAFGAGIDTFDELKESVCLGVQTTGKNTFISGGQTIQCNKLFNAIAGFCEPSGGKPVEPKRIVGFSPGKINELGLNEFGREKILYLFIIPEKGTTEGEEIYKYRLGYVAEKLKFDKSEEKGKYTGKIHFVSADLEAVELANVDNYFTKENIENYKLGKITESSQVITGLQAEIAKQAGITEKQSKIPTSKVKKLYGEVVDFIGVGDQEYIVQPDSTFIRAFQCLCIPAIQSWLEMIKQIGTAIKNCLQSVRLTGDGSTGWCQALLSQYVCDVLYDLISCFSQKYSAGGGISPNIDTGYDLLGAATSAGSRLADRVTTRYGESSMFKAIFSERKLVHSVCAWAFTGTWNLDFGPAYDQSLGEIPIDSFAIIEPADRRFVGPVLAPEKGLVTWLYHFGIGMAAGADLDLELKLKCSAGYKCKASDGFQNGECDCNKKGEKIITIKPKDFRDKLSKGEIYEDEIFYTMQGIPGDGAVRYDTAILSYRYKDSTGKIVEKTAESKIGQTGSVPGFCNFNPFRLSFMCELGEQSTIAIRDLNITMQEPTYKMTGDRKAAILNAPISLNIDLTQDYPMDIDLSKTKFLKWEIQRGTGDIVQSNEDNLAELKTSGDYTKKIPVTAKSSWFKTGTAQKYTINFWDSNFPLSPKPEDIERIIDLNYLKIESSKTQFLVLQFYKTTTDNTEQIFYKLFKGTNSITTTTNGFEKQKDTKGNAILLKEGKADGKTIEFQDTNILVQIAYKTPTLKTEQNKELHIKYMPTGVQNTPQEFKALITIYDADDYGQPTEIQSVDLNTGLYAVKDKNFYAMNVEEKDLPKAEEPKKPEEPIESTKCEGKYKGFELSCEAECTIGHWNIPDIKNRECPAGKTCCGSRKPPVIKVNGKTGNIKITQIPFILTGDIVPADFYQTSIGIFHLKNGITIGTEKIFDKIKNLMTITDTGFSVELSYEDVNGWEEFKIAAAIFDDKRSFISNEINIKLSNMLTFDDNTIAKQIVLGDKAGLISNFALPIKSPAKKAYLLLYGLSISDPKQIPVAVNKIGENSYNFNFLFNPKEFVENLTEPLWIELFVEYFDPAISMDNTYKIPNSITLNVTCEGALDLSCVDNPCSEYTHIEQYLAMCPPGKYCCGSAPPMIDDQLKLTFDDGTIEKIISVPPNDKITLKSFFKIPANAKLEKVKLKLTDIKDSTKTKTIDVLNNIQSLQKNVFYFHYQDLNVRRHLEKWTNPIELQLNVVDAKKYTFDSTKAMLELHCKQGLCYADTEICGDYGLEEYSAMCPEGTHCCN